MVFHTAAQLNSGRGVVRRRFCLAAGYGHECVRRGVVSGERKAGEGAEEGLAATQSF